MTGTITRVNRGNGAYDVSYMHGGNDRKVPNNLVRPKDKSDTQLQMRRARILVRRLGVSETCKGQKSLLQ